MGGQEDIGLQSSSQSGAIFMSAAALGTSDPFFHLPLYSVQQQQQQQKTLTRTIVS